MSQTSPPSPDGWRLDRRIPTTLAVSIAAQLAAMVWFAAAQHATINDHDRRIVAMEAGIRDFDHVRDTRFAEIAERLTRLEDGEDEIKRVLGVTVQPRVQGVRP